MPVFNNFNDIYKYISKSSKYPLEKVGAKVTEHLTNYILDNWYDSNEPEYYGRTYEFVNSITVTKAKEIGGIISVDVYFDTDKIRAYEPAEIGDWGRHRSLDGEDVSNLIPFFIEHGNGGSKAYSYDGIGMVEATVNYFRNNKELALYLKTQLSLMGIKSTVGAI